MKTEQKQLLGFIGRCGILISFASLFAVGGSGDFWGGQLWIRRWLAPFLLCVWGAILARDWRPLVCFPFMGAALTMPYGADLLWQKILLRSVFGLFTGVTFNIYNFWCSRHILAILGFILAYSGVILLGVWNPTTNAMQEQGLIGLLIATTFVFGVRKK